MSLKETLLGASAVMVALSAAAPVALAQEESAGEISAEDSRRLPTVTVSAQKKEESLQSVPISVTAIDAKLLADTGVTGNLELGQISPGLVTIEGSGFFVPYVRGIGSRAITPGNESPVAFYVDGVYQTDKAGLLLGGFNDVDSIQVLRGPQGTLFGRNATAGAVLVETRKPGQKFELDAKATYGTDETSGAVFIGGPIAPTLSASLSGFFRNEDDYIRNINPANNAGNKIGSTRASGVRGKLLWEPTASLSAMLSADYVDSVDEAPWAVQALPGTGLTVGEAVALGNNIPIPDIRNQRPVYGGEGSPEVNHDGKGVSLTIDWALDSVDVKSITAWRSDRSSGFLDLDGTPLPLFYFITRLESDVLQQEINIASNGGGPLSWQVGAYYLDMEDGYLSLDQNVGIPFPYSPEVLATLPPGAAHILANSMVEIESLAIFGELYYDLTDKTKLTLGLRYTDEEHSLKASNNQVVTVPDGAGGILVLPPSTPVAACNAAPDCNGLSAPFNKLTYRLVLAQQFTDDIMGYVSYNRGFKSGVYNISTITNYKATDPEILDAFEVGLKSSLLNNRLNINTALYYNDYKDLQVQVTEAGTNTQITINAASAVTSGLEVEAQFQATENFYLSGGFATFFKAEYESFNNCGVYLATGAGNAQITGDCSGSRMPATPDYTFHIAGDYIIPLRSGAEIALNGLFSYSDEFAFDATSPTSTPAPRQPALETLNLSATWRSPGDRFSVSAWGRNILDPDDVLRGMFTTGFGFHSTYARGATYGVTAGVKF